MVSQIRSHFLCISKKTCLKNPLLEKKFENPYLWMKSSLRRRGNCRKPQQLTQILHLAKFSKHVQISCLKNQHPKNQIICLTASFIIALRKDKLKVSHARINIFWCNKNASTEPHNYPINLVFAVNENLVYFRRFFLDVSQYISQNMTFWREDAKTCKNVIFLKQDHFPFL